MAEWLGGIAEAAERTSGTRHELDAETQQQLAEVQKQYVAARSSAELLDEYKQGLIPQAEAMLCLPSRASAPMS